MNRNLVTFAAFAIGLFPSLAGAQGRVNIEHVAHSAGESLSSVVPPEASIAVPKGSPVKMTAPSKEAWGVMVDRSPRPLGITAAPCARRPSRAIVCSLDESIKLSDARIPGMLGAGLDALLAREARMSGPVFHPAHRYTTRNGSSEFSCYHRMVQTRCRWEKYKIEMGIVDGIPQFKFEDRWVCDEVEAQSHDCVCTRGCD